MDEAEIAWIAETALTTLERDEALPPEAVVLLLRRYLATGDDGLADAIGVALAQALDAFEGQDLSPDAAESRDRWQRTGSRARWLLAFLTATSFSDDDRLRAIVVALAGELRREWPLRGDVGPAVRAIEACVRATPVLGDRGNLVQAAIDELERIVRIVYEPGEGITRTIEPSDDSHGRLRDVVSAASALLTAYEVTGRLPYAMLAEELVQFARRTWWDEARGCFDRESGLASMDLEPFVANSEAARVLLRLAALHEEPDYRAHAVIAPDARYGELAERLLLALRSSSRQHGLAAAVYGLALMESAQ